MKSNKIDIINKMAPALKELAEIYCKYAPSDKKANHLSVEVWQITTQGGSLSVNVEVQDNNDKDLLKFEIDPTRNRAIYELDVELEE